MIGHRSTPREVVVSRSKLESLAWDNRDTATITFTATSAYLALGDGVVFVAALSKVAS